ncbi:MAG: HzsA-related protein [Pirellulaceae bacterium]
MNTAGWMLLAIVALHATLIAPPQCGLAQQSGPSCTECDRPAMYEPQVSLQTTLLTTRQRYRAWLSEQPAVRQAIEWGPWYATSLLPADQADQQVRPAEGLNTAPVETGGVETGSGTLWAQRRDLSDGQTVNLLTGPPGTVLYLTRTLRTTQAVKLTLGVGGGEHLEAWVNGRKIASVATRLIYGRYGCSDSYEGTRVDQVLLDLDLDPGANSLVLRLTAGGEPSFYFSPTPNLIPAFWKQLRRDFPASENPLLDLVHADWFETGGWFTAQGTQLEEHLLDRLIAEGAGSLRAEFDQLKQSAAARDDARWLDLSVKSSVLAKLHGELARLRAAVESLGFTHGGQYPSEEFLQRLDEYAQRVERHAAEKLDPVDDTTRGLLAEMPRMRRDMLVDCNPMLQGAEIVFVKRYTYNSKHYYDDFQHISAWGGNICVLSLSDARVRELVPQLTGGVFDRYDLSFDAGRIVFGYRRPRPEGYRLYEIGVDGQGLRPITQPPPEEAQRIAIYGRTSYGDGFYGLQGYQFWTDDVHPCYLPDGGVSFASTRSEHGVLCTPAHYLACTNIFRLDADGGGLRPLSHGALSEFTPTVMEDGRILYNRWEYVYKGIAATQPLWTMRPDGSGSEEFYGDNIAHPGVFWQARQVPGHPRLAVCIGCGHEPLGVGQVLLLDMSKDKRTRAPITNLTPDVNIQNLRGIYHLRNSVWREDFYGPLYSDPYPLSDKFFLVSCNPDGRYNDPAGYGIYLLDAFGNRVPLYHDPEISAWQPMLLRPRPAPPVIASVVDPLAERSSAAIISISDVYRGLEGVEPGTIKYLRVMEQVAKPWSAELDQARGEDRSADGFGGHLAVSWNAHIWIAVLHGVVPVEADGSAFFHVPAGRNLFFQALDENYMEVQRMRTFVNFLPGEARSCIGCHEHRTQAPAPGDATAFLRPPTELSAQPGDVAPRPLYYPTDVQPILDRHCIQCHDGSPVSPMAPTASVASPPVTPIEGGAAKAAPDLRGEMTELFSRSYESLMQGKWINTIQEWNGADYSMMHAEAVPPYTYGAHRSRLIDVLRNGHYEVQLDRAEFIRLVTWIDSGAPYYGSYFGRRNLQYRGQPDFRPVPTLSSACGIAPPEVEIPHCEPLPARLLAWWPLSDTILGATAEESMADESEASPRGPGNGTAQSQGPNGGGGRRFDGNEFIACGGLGTHEAVSIALRAKSESLGHTWNPLLFGNDVKSGIVHFSLQADGRPNVAINTLGQNWTHRTARTSVAIGQWHHLVLVCDARLGGRVRFYIDGHMVSEDRLSLGIRLDLDGFRLGAWNQWEGSPANNFHGEIRDVRIYSGMLTDAQCQQLAAGR